MIRPILLGALSLCASGAAAQAPPRAPARKDTAGTYLRPAWAQARGKYADALLVSISGRTDATGAVVCDPQVSLEDGWLFTFYSPKTGESAVVAECAGQMTATLRQMMTREGVARPAVQGHFIDSDFTLELLAKSGVSLDPMEHHGGGKRPFDMTLSRMEADRFPTQPVVWEVHVGKDSFFVDAVKKEIFDPNKYSESADTNSARALEERPRRSKLYTARADLDKVLRYAQSQLRGARLMAVEGTVNAWGSSSCTNPVEGWAYYFYIPRLRDFAVLYACNGAIGQAQARSVPVDFGTHQPLDAAFVDSDKAVDSVLERRGSAMDDGPRRFRRKGTLRLLNYRTSPFTSMERWKTTMVWHLEMGTTLYRLDAQKGGVIDVSE